MSQIAGAATTPELNPEDLKPKKLKPKGLISLFYRLYRFLEWSILTSFGKRLQSIFSDSDANLFALTNSEGTLEAIFSKSSLEGIATADRWRALGGQTDDPTKELWNGRYICLENLKNFAVEHNAHYMEILKLCRDQKFPLPQASVNVTFMLVEMFDLEADKPRTFVGTTFLKLLSENPKAFDLLYCVVFRLTADLWDKMHPSHRNFSIAMNLARRQVERELLLLKHGQRIEDMQSHKLLFSSV